MRSAHGRLWRPASRPAAAPAADSNNGVRRGPDGRHHPRPQHLPTPDVDRLEHRLYQRQPLHLASGRGAAGRR